MAIEVFKTSTARGEGEVRSWASLLDHNCRRQAEAISRAPIVEGYLALMPDAHFGFGPPVGSALKTRDALMPYAIGVDIGCGMIAVKTELERFNLIGHEERILEHIRKLIPSGMGNSHARPIHQAENFFHDHGWPVAEKNVLKGKDSFRATAAIQFGTLGSGNHFVEVSVDESDRVWLVLHSGSRGAGNQLANFHVKVAQDLCAKQYIRLESKEFAYVQRDTPQYDAYVHDMLWGQEYAAAQREAMMDNLILAVELGVGLPVDSLATGVRVNCHHNYAEEIEPGLWLTRKGAINASVGMFGVVPGSMGTDTYIIAGLGNEESYCTSPHGAGRLLGRNVARKTLDVEQFREDMAGRTWLNSYADALLDEAPSAYKPIEVVMADSVDLIRPVAKLSAVINYKGL